MIAKATEETEEVWQDPDCIEEEKKQMDLRATIVLVPNNMVMTRVEELQNNFKDCLDFSILYGHQWQIADPIIKNGTLPSGVDAAIAALHERCPVGKIESLRHVVVASYETFKDRFVTTITREQMKEEASMY